MPPVQTIDNQDPNDGLLPVDVAQAAASDDGIAGSNDDVDFPVETKSADNWLTAPLDLTLAPRMALDIAEVLAFLDRCRDATPRVGYGLGAKVPFQGAVPGKDFTRIDCSGFVREAIRLATTPMVKFPDGSWHQHRWVRDNGYQPATIADGSKTDDRIRIAYLDKSQSTSGVGHILLLHDGYSIESHGGVGPNRRKWTGTGWQGKMQVYRLT